MERRWCSLFNINENKDVVGRVGEYLAYIEFLCNGFDVYCPEVDNSGVDFIAEKGDLLYKVQVKSVR